jgi:hypothetical protein
MRSITSKLRNRSKKTLGIFAYRPKCALRLVFGWYWLKQVRMDWNLGQGGMKEFLVLVCLTVREITRMRNFGRNGTKLLTMVTSPKNKINPLCLAYYMH